MRAVLTAIALALPLPLTAETLDPDRLWSLMTTGDFRQVETELEIVRAEVRKGTISFGQQRRLYQLFETTHPEMLEAIDDWLAERPDSIHAAVAKTSSLQHIAFLIRGLLPAAYVHSEAMAEAQRLRDQGYDLIWRTYRSAPDFIPASDKVVQYYHDFPGEQPFEQTIAEIMEVTPNKGTLLLALGPAAPRWGGSVELVFRLCQQYAAKLPDDPGYTSDLCKVQAIYEHQIYGEVRDWARGVLDRTDNARLAKAHLIDSAYDRFTRPAMKWRFLKWYEESGINDPEIAGRLEGRYGVEDLEEKERERQGRIAEAALDHDPLNPDLIIKTVRANIESFDLPPGPVFTFGYGTPGKVNLGTTHRGRIPPPTLDHPYRDLAEAALEYGTYNPEVWQLLGDICFCYTDPEGHLYVIEMNRIAAVVTNYNIGYLESYYTAIRTNWVNWHWAIERGATEWDGKPFDPVQLRENLDCPYVQATRLVELACSYQSAWECRPSGSPMTEVQLFLEDPESGQYCPEMWAAEPEDLLLSDEF